MTGRSDFLFSRVLKMFAVALVFALAANAAWAQATRPLEARATSQIREALFPDADRFELSDGAPPYLRVYVGDEQVGYIFSTLDIVRARSYSPIPFDAIAGMDLAGNLTGAKVIRQHDPYLTGFPQRVARLGEFLDAHVGYPVDGTATAPLTPDFVQGTTVSARNMRAGIMDAGRIILRANDPRPPITEPTLDRITFSFFDWDQLLEMGAVSNRLISFGDVSAAFAEQGVTPVEMDVPLDRGSGEDRYTELVVALATPPVIGRNVIVASAYSDVVESAPDDVVMLAVMSGGYYDFRGSEYESAEFENRFDRVRLEQGDLELEFFADDFQRVGPTVQRSGGPIVRHSGLFTIPLSSGFDPFAPFDVILMVHATDAAGVEHTVEFPVTYQVPEEAVLMPYVEPLPPWAEAWLDSGLELGILAAALIVLTLIFVFQHQLSRNRKLHLWVRTGFLVFTLVWLGWIAGGQLSIVHIVNYIRAPFEGADLGFYLAEPLIVVISIYVLLSLFLIGRGVFCGWLCPFGALQELTSRIARLLRLPVWNPSQNMQRWMWLPKYGLAALIVGTAFAVPEALASVEEVEPFKTAITSAFTRPWPYVTYALVLLVMGLFTERFFCRFLCPLGGVLALGDRLHLFTFLKRRPECGVGGCHLCERSCPVKAIERSGKIVMAECFQCLDCQVEYYDDHRCPPLAQDRKRRERAANPGLRRPLVMTLNGKVPPATV
ncbi:4Fe-4S binding protein [Pelagibacterium mangrovi]|uniref:4Fe-4S binding protein n=1 Tax=Pelagibacterium mangrovi TaxID=3119828 RepID=UPI002FCB5727